MVAAVATPLIKPITMAMMPMMKGMTRMPNQKLGFIAMLLNSCFSTTDILDIFDFGFQILDGGSKI